MKDIRNSTNSTFATSPKSIILSNRKKHYARFSEGVEFQRQHLQYQFNNDKWISKYQQIYQNNEQINAFKKYSQFMNLQNRIISQVLLNGSQLNSINKNIQEEMLCKLRASTDEFIKNILQNLTESNFKLTVVKNSTSSKIQQLQYQLNNQREQVKLLQLQINEQSRHYEEKFNTYVNLMQAQTRKIQELYETKINQLSKKLQIKQTNYDLLLTQKIQLNNRLIHIQKSLKVQKQQVNNKNKQYEGMGKLINQYQKQLLTYEKKISEMQNEIKKLVCNTHCLQQNNNKLMSDTNRIKLLQENLASAQVKNIQLTNKIEKQTKNLLKIIGENKSFMTQKEEIIKLLQIEMQSKQQKINNLLGELELKSKIEANYKFQIIKQKNKVKQKIEYIKKMHQKKQSLIKKAINSKLKQLKIQNQKLKTYFQRQIFNFYQQIRMDLLINSPISSNFMITKNNRMSL